LQASHRFSGQCPDRRR